MGHAARIAAIVGLAAVAATASGGVGAAVAADTTPPPPATVESPNDGESVTPSPFGTSGLPVLGFSYLPDPESGTPRSDWVLDGAVIGSTLSPPRNLAIADGPHRFSITTINGVGLSTPGAPIVFWMDRGRVLADLLVSPTEGETTPAQPTFTWRPARDLGGRGVTFEYRVVVGGTPSAWTTGTSFTWPTPLPGGRADVVLEARDSTGLPLRNGPRSIVITGAPAPPSPTSPTVETPAGQNAAPQAQAESPASVGTPPASTPPADPCAGLAGVALATCSARGVHTAAVARCASRARAARVACVATAAAERAFTIASAKCTTMSGAARAACLAKALSTRSAALRAARCRALTGKAKARCLVGARTRAGRG